MCKNTDREKSNSQLREIIAARIIHHLSCQERLEELGLLEGEEGCFTNVYKYPIAGCGEDKPVVPTDRPRCKGTNGNT